MWANLNKAPPAHPDESNAYPTSTASSPASFLEPPPQYSAGIRHEYSDPRISSQQSLVPSNPDLDDDQRRKLLVIYIHGFNGNSQSFRSFPAHVHNFLRNALSETHVVHTKLYPRYKTYRAVEVARDKFSEWLRPHEGPNIDIILVGHSMGGILAADVILLPNLNPSARQPFKHRILGHISLDCPFLGLHPGIIVSGIASLFQPSPKPPPDPTYIQPRGSQSTVAVGDGSSSVIADGSSPYFALPPEPQRPDPNFNAPFFNDKIYEERPFLQSIFSFIKKHHAEGVANSFAQRLVDQLEFGGCLADYNGLHTRYKRLRALEDVDEIRMVGEGHPAGAYARVRFVNYYTLSSGIHKNPKTSGEGDADPVTDRFMTDKIGNVDSLSIDPLHEHSGGGAVTAPRSSISVTVEDDSHGPPQPAGQNNLSGEPSQEPDSIRFSRLSMQEVEPTPILDSDEPFQGEPEIATTSEPADATPSRTLTEELDLPPLPKEPTPPSLPDLDAYHDKASRKQAEKESKRLQKAYEQALKDRAKSIREREKLIEKRRKEAQKSEGRQDREVQKNLDRHEQKEKQRLQKEEQRLEKERQRQDREAEKLRKNAAARGEPSGTTSRGVSQRIEADNLEEDTQAPDAAAPKKRKKFCTLPRKVNGKADEAWVDIYMENMNEVTAHCSLFFAGPHYDRLVGEISSKIVGWVQDDLTKRAILEMPVD